MPETSRDGTGPSNVAARLGIVIAVVAAVISLLLLFSYDSAAQAQESDATATPTATATAQPEGGIIGQGCDFGNTSCFPEVRFLNPVSTLDARTSRSFKVETWDIQDHAKHILKVSISNNRASFDNRCPRNPTDTSSVKSYTLNPGTRSLSKSITLYGCRGGSSKVKLELRKFGSSTVLAKAEKTVRVNEPPTPTPTPTYTPTPTNTPTPTPTPEPEISISGLDDLEMEVDDNYEFSVKASDLSSSERYTIIVTTDDDDDITFDSDCDDTDDSERVPSGSTRHTAEFTLYACDTSGAEVTANLVSGGSTVASASESVSVTEEPTPTPTPTATPTPGPTSSVGGLWVDITSSDEYPSSGDDVTLTASVLGAPSGGTMSYQWQTKSGSSWSDDGSASSSPTKEVSSSVRGTKAYKVVATHSDGATGTSLPFFVTWDEWAIAVDMIKAMVAEVEKKIAGTTAHTTAQTALANCINRNVILGGSSTRTQINTLGDVLSSYTGPVKSVADDECESEFDAMLAVVERESENALKALKTGDGENASEYAALLETDHGRYFEKSVSAPYIVKQFAYMLVTEPADLQSSGGISGQGGSLPPTGLACLPSDGEEPSTLYGKMRVLNCLVFQTPHSFWASATQFSALKAAIDKNYETASGETVTLSTWMGYGDDVCTWWHLIDRDPPTSSCRKHDVAFDSLQKFNEDEDEDDRANELDLSWNPRNKHLADAEGHSNIIAYSCTYDVSDEISVKLCPLDVKAKAAFMHWGFNKANNKGWPVTSHDVKDASVNNRFRECDIPKITNVSTSSGSSLTQRHYTVQWEYQPGCVSDIEVDHYKLCWERKTLGVLKGIDTCEIADGTKTEHTLKVLLLDPASYTFKSAEIRPKDVVYGGLFGFERANSTVEFLTNYQFGGIYYPKQVNP